MGDEWGFIKICKFIKRLEQFAIMQQETIISDMMQVKSKQRVIDHGEVFTAQREINAMLDLVKGQTERIDSTFLEPACGNGNFLIGVLKRKLEVIDGRYIKNQIEWERYAVIAISSMYLTDYRERSLKDVITQLEPGLFKKVTGLNVKDFELLVSLGVFNSALMNDAVYKFKRYEDSSLEYIGINKHEGEDIGLYDTVLSAKDYVENFVNED